MEPVYVIGPRTVADSSLFLMVTDASGEWRLDHRADEVGCLILGNEHELPRHAPRIRVRPVASTVIRRNYG